MQHFAFAGGLLEKLPSAERVVGSPSNFFVMVAALVGGQFSGSQQGASNERQSQHSSFHSGVQMFSSLL